MTSQIPSRSGAEAWPLEPDDNSPSGIRRSHWGDETASAPVDIGPRPGSLGRLAVNQLAVEFGDFALGPLSLQYVGPQIISLVGPNGSGKSTLMRCLLGLEREASGAAYWNGEDLTRRNPRVLARVGYMSDSADDLLPELTAREYWDLCALAYTRNGSNARPPNGSSLQHHAENRASALHFDPPNRAIASFSLGMRRKTQLVGSLMHDPELIILDEPFIGLDFMAVRALERMLAADRQRGATILASSHDLRITQDLADQLVLMHHGRVLMEDRIDAVTAGAGLDARIESVIRHANPSHG